MKKTLLLVTVALIALAGCNTIGGIGKDIQKAGSSIEDASKKK